MNGEPQHSEPQHSTRSLLQTRLRLFGHTHKSFSYRDASACDDRNVFAATLMMLASQGMSTVCVGLLALVAAEVCAAALLVGVAAEQKATTVVGKGVDAQSLLFGGDFRSTAAGPPPTVAQKIL